MDRLTEKWRPIPGWDGMYDVSDNGRVRSLDRTVTTSTGHRRTYRGRVLTPGHHKRGGYLFVNLVRGGRQHHRKVHALVCEAFNGERPDGATLVRHLDGDIYNNTPDNLAWGTVSDNLHDAVRHGTHHQASQTECKRGHPLSGDNLYVNPASNSRQCRKCQAIHRTNYKARKNAA
jgi:hypothetical protein